MTGRLEGERILVTGGASGLGEAIVRRIAEDGGVPLVADIDEAACKQLAADVNGIPLNLDVSSEASWESALLNVQELVGGLDGVVNNAGIAKSTGPEDIEGVLLDDFRRIFSVNVEGTLLGCKLTIPMLAAAGGGSIVNLSSIAALIPSSFVISYGASKATIAHMTRSVAHHCAQKGYNIRCNSVHPGQVRTSMMNSIIDRVGDDLAIGHDEAEKAFLAQIPLGSFQEPVDIAHATVFLLSNEARYITGSQVVVDGGMTLSN